MAEVRSHSFWAVIVICVLTFWLILIVVVISFVYPRASKNSKTELLLARTYPATVNNCSERNGNIYYLNMTQCNSLTEIARNECTSQKVCVSKCPTVTYNPNLTDSQNLAKASFRWKISRKFVICLRSTRNDTSTVPPPLSFLEYLQKIADGLCPDKVFRSTPFFNKLCLPVEVNDPALQHLKSSNAILAEKMEQRADSVLARKRRSHEMFYTWVSAGCCITGFFICLYFILFIYFIRFTVYFSLFSFLIVLLAGLCMSLRMAIVSAIKGTDDSMQDPYLTFGIHWICWTVLTAVIILILYLYFDFFHKCFYSIPKAIQFLIYANRGIGGIKSAMVLIFIGIFVQLILVFCFVQLLIVIFHSSQHLSRIHDLTDDCICINNYVEGSQCNKINFGKWCKDRISGGPCLQGSCDIVSVVLTPTEIFLTAALVVTTYYLMWFVKGSIDMIIGTTFVHWYRDNFTSTIPFKQLLKKTGYCFKYQSGTLALGSLVMFSVGIFHVLFQFIEHLVLFTVEIKKVRRKKMVVSTLEWLSKTTSPLIYIEAGVYNSSYSEALKKIDLTRSSKTKNVRLINRLVDMVLFICALLVVVVNSIGLAIVYAFPHTFIQKTKSKDIFDIMNSPLFIFFVLVGSSYFLVANILSMYSISVNAIFLCYISDIPAEVSRRRKYRSSKVISEDTHPDKFDVLGKLNELGESVSVGDKNSSDRTGETRQTH